MGGAGDADESARVPRHRQAAIWLGLVLWIGAVVVLAGAVMGTERDVASARQSADDEPASVEARFVSALEEDLGYQIDAHQAAEGPQLLPQLGPHNVTSFVSQTCPAGTTVKAYDVVALRVDITLNRWGDHDPEGYMYALAESVPAIREQEAKGADEHYGLSLGLGSDPIQPLTLRANVGDCVRITFENQVTEPASFTVHGADLVVAATGEPALTSNPDSSVLPGESAVYEWYVDPTDYEENTHYVHSHGARGRFQVGHGLFGAIIIEPAGSTYLDQRTGDDLCRDDGGVERCASSWDAIISPGEGADFREFTVFYHEIGNERYAVLDADGMPNPSIDPVVHSYKPNGRAINYRSESFFRRMGELAEQVPFYTEWEPDEAEAYGSYAFGDPAMPIPQSYVGDPAKFRLVHGGSETVHVPHLHGGGIQWQRQPKVGEGEHDFTAIDAGLKKEFASSMPSSGNDSQTIAPSETYELEISCGSGGCQQTVGDFLFHCHVASHYISGMWHFWRVYNTLQDEAGKTDELAVVAELPDRRGGMQRAVTSDELVGTTVEFAGRTVDVDPATLGELVETQLPPQGRPRHAQDATVMDWSREGTQYLNEPETGYSWPNFTAEDPGGRLPFLFDPATGKLAYPFLRPHLGQRPPFAPDHGPAPFLDPLDEPHAQPPTPGASGATSLCPAGAPRRFYKVHAIGTDIPVTDSLTDENGMIFVLKENEELARSDPEYKVPLAIRANQGDCVDVMLVNELPADEGDGPTNLMKTNIHIHFVQFDVQASDGVVSGASFEQAVRPITAPGTGGSLAREARSGDVRVTVSDPTAFHPGATVAVGVDQDSQQVETAEIRDVRGNDVIFVEPLQNNHAAGELVSTEFVRYRWYVARQNGAIYFHDHVDALNRWGHGLFGALIAEPTGSTYRHPVSGREVDSGPVADILTTGQVVPGLEGPFREFVLFMNDRNPITGSSFNLRAEPLHAETDRGSGPPDLALSSVPYGDPHTPILRAYAGDPVMLRLLTTATEEVHPFHITGHTFRQERFQEESPWLTSFGVGISERFNAYVPAAGGPSQLPGDYLYYNGTERHFRNGAWGIFRVFGDAQVDLLPLPGRTPAPGGGSATRAQDEPLRARTPGDACPDDAPLRHFDVAVVDVPLVFNLEAGLTVPTGRIYVLESQRRAVTSGLASPEPLVLRANAGDCVEVKLTNRSTQPASMNFDAMAADPQGSLGITVGRNPRQSVRPGEATAYRVYTPYELGTVVIRDFGNVFRNAREGLYGALIVEPAGATYQDPYTGEPLEGGVAAVIRVPGEEDFREFVTLFQDNDPDIGLFVMPYDQEVNRLTGVNYRAEPMTERLAALGVVEDGDPIAPEDYELASRFFDPAAFGDPTTAVFEAYAGDRVVFRVASPYSEQVGIFSVEGHQWRLTPELEGSDLVSGRYLPSGAAMDVDLGPAGGPAGRPGDYVWGNHRMPYQRAGQWGFLRVLDPNSSDLLPLGE